MARVKQIGICSSCHELRALFDVKNKICGPCAGKKGGTAPKKPRRLKYLCDACEKPVYKSQQVCNCGAKVDWSNVQKVTHGPAAN